MRKAFMLLTVVAAVGIGSSFGGMAVKTEAAGNIDQLNGQKQQVEQKRAKINSNIKNADSKIADLQGKQVNVTAEIERLGKSIDDTNGKIQEKTAKVTETKAQISKLQAEIKVIQARIEKRNQLLKERARNYQENGSVNYLSVLLGSKSFSDFIDRASAVATIVQADQEILQAAEADKQELEKKQAEVKTELANLQSLLDELKNMKQELNAQKAEKDKLLGTLKKQEKEATQDKMSLEEQRQVLDAQTAAIQKAIELEKAHQAELARQAKAAARRSSSGSSSGSAASSSPAPAVSSGSFTWPAAGVVTSGFGGRASFGSHAGGFHPGIDIASSGSGVPILAAADGVVIRSYLSSSYGNCIFVAHSINGQVYTTVYAHMSSRLVGNGATVHKGQQIGVMGSTGDSTGQHLHFEVHRGSWNYAKTNAINPMSVLP